MRLIYLMEIELGWLEPDFLLPKDRSGRLKLSNKGYSCIADVQSAGHTVLQLAWELKKQVDDPKYRTVVVPPANVAKPRPELASALCQFREKVATV